MAQMKYQGRPDGISEPIRRNIKAGQLKYKGRSDVIPKQARRNIKED